MSLFNINLGGLNLLQASLIACAVLAGLAGGATFAFSNFIMRALGRLPEADAIAAMRAINVTAINPLFMLVLIGTGLFALVLTGLVLGGVIPSGAPAMGTGWLLAGTVCFVVGVVGVTIFGNVPLNETLAHTETLSWSAYARPWMTWNHVRTAAAAIAAAAFAHASSGI